MNSKTIGPELPPGLKRPISPCDDVPEEDGQKDEPTVPAIGPALPPHLQKRPTSSSESQPSTSKSAAREPATIGPALPPHLQHLGAGEEQKSGSSTSDSNSSDEDGQIGPSVGLQGGEYDVKEEFADRQRRAEASKNVVLERESWMTELPDDRTGVKIGLGARMFTKRDGTDTVLDDSWTATPGQEKKPKIDKKIAQNQQDLAQRKRDAEIDEHLEKFNAAKRSKPLIDMHKEESERKLRKKAKKEKKLKKKDKKHKKDKKKKSKKDKGDDKSDDEAPPVRKPFNWEEDMRVSMVDTTRAKSMLDRAQLQSRFAPSKTQKYL